MNVHPLNLPEINASLRKADGKVWIFDIIRKKYVVLTPEEWVRQHFVHYMITDRKYPKSLIKVEGSLAYNRLQKRSDIVLHDRSGNPWMLVECKSPVIRLTQKAFNQVSVYNMTIGARFVVVTNGMVHYCFDGGAQVDNLPEFP